MKTVHNQSQFSEKLTLKIVLVAFLTLIVLVMTILLISVNETNKGFSNQLDKDLNHIITLQSRVEEMDNLTASLSSYVFSGDLPYFSDYNAFLSEISEFVFLSRNIQRTDKGYYLYYDLKKLFESYTEQAERTIQLYESDAQTVYVNEQVFELTKNNNFVKEQLSKIISYELNVVKDKYGDLEVVVDQREEMVYFVVFLVIVITLSIGIFLANRLVYPIHTLSTELRRIGKGQYDSKPLEAKGIGEVSSMIRDFNKMKVRLTQNIELIHENARIKEQLSNQEINLLETENHLKQSKLDYLQSQINPHFLYNTLNSIQTLADIEEAPQTEKMLYHLSSLMRYNVKKLNTVVMLREEMEIINSYVYIQLIRFGDRIQYEVDCDEEALDTQVPSMIIQPLVENAMIHGLESKMGQGVLLISIKKTEDQVTIIVRDNGKGMEPSVTERLLSYGDDNSQANGEEDISKNTKSIGVANVVRKCRLFYGKNVVSINSVLGAYTEFKIVIEENGDI